jgi:hypothetical protein
MYSIRQIQGIIDDLFVLSALYLQRGGNDSVGGHLLTVPGAKLER